MLEIRFHGRGGQGAVTSAEILAQAAILDGRYAHAFPSFGPERRGAPVAAFCRVADKPLLLRTMIKKPHIVIVLDPSLVKNVDVTQGLADDGVLVMNSEKDPCHFTFNRLQKVATINATQIALEVLRRPITNFIVLGALLRIFPVVSTGALMTTVEHRFEREIADLNKEALQRAYEETVLLDIVPGKKNKKRIKDTSSLPEGGPI